MLVTSLNASSPSKKFEKKESIRGSSAKKRKIVSKKVESSVSIHEDDELDEEEHIAPRTGRTKVRNLKISQTFLKFCWMESPSMGWKMQTYENM